MDRADYFAGARVRETSDVAAGSLEAIEESGGSFGFQSSGGQGMMTTERGGLDGFGIFDDVELDVLAGDELAAGLGSVTEAMMALVERGWNLHHCPSARDGDRH